MTTARDEGLFSLKQIACSWGEESPLEKFLKDDLGEPRRPSHTCIPAGGSGHQPLAAPRPPTSDLCWKHKLVFITLDPKQIRLVSPPTHLPRPERHQLCLPSWFALQTFEKTQFRIHEALTQTHTSRRRARIVRRLTVCHAQSSELKCSAHVALEEDSLR